MFKNEKYLVVDHKYLNTGGNTMVSIFTVYNHRKNTTLYIVANEEGFNVQTVDTVSCEFSDFDEKQMEAIVIGYYDWDTLTCEPAPWDMLFEDEEWKLYKYCQFEFYKKDCKHFRTKIGVPYEWLPNDLFQQLTADAVEWLRANDENVKTDGETIELPDAYNDYLKEKLDKELQALKDFKEWLDKLVGGALVDEKVMERLYEKSFKLSFNGKEVELCFDADNYNNISDLLQAAIENF